MLALLQSSSRDFVDLYEFYDTETTNLAPENASQLFAETEAVWFGWKYLRQAISRSEISRFIDGKFNNVTLTFSNVDRSLATFLYNSIEGFRVVVRMVSRSVDDDSIVLFVGRCEKPVDVDNTTVSITAKQDLGSIENDLPWSKFAKKCPLDFKGTECLAGEAIGTKSAAYQAATTCDKSFGQCTTYVNTKAFGGFRFNAVKGNFKVSQARGGAGGALLGLIGLGNHKVSKQYSSQDDSPYGATIPLGLGRTQIDMVVIQHADTGQYLAGQWLAGEGLLTKLLNVRNVSAGWASSFQAYSAHLGDYGPTSEQNPLGFFASGGDRHSHRSYVEITIKGDNPDTGDAAPTIVATVLWLKIPTFGDSCFTNSDWSDNPVEHLRFLLTEPRSLNYDAGWIDNTICAETAQYCNEPLIDQTGAEDVYVSTSSGTPGTDYKRYRSTGLLDTKYWLYILGLTATYPAENEVTYNTYDPASPPSSPTATTYYRKRYTANWHLKEPTKAADFIFKSLLPSFRGYLITGADGKLQIKSRKPIISSYLRSSATAGTSSLAIEDAYAWKNLVIPIVHCLVGANTSTSETHVVSSILYSTAGNSITLAASGSGTASGGTLSGGTTSIQANGTVTIGSAASCTITIDSVPIAYTANASDTAATVAAMLATMINANTTLNRYVMAIWTKDLPTQVLIRSKLGTLTLATPLAATFSTLKQVVHIHLPFSDVSFGCLTRGNILKDSFKWPLGSRQSSYNQFFMQYTSAVDDYQSVQLLENDTAHQAATNKISKLEISGACVDNYHQADRLVQGSRYEYRDGDFFNQLASTGLSLLLEEGDIVCANHDNMPGRRNLLQRVEELKIAQDHRVSVIGRLYADSQYPIGATPSTVVLTTGVGWASAVPGPVTTFVLTSPESSTLRGTFSFAGYIGTQTARIEILRPGDVAYSDTGIRVSPDSLNAGAFEITGLTAGITYVRVTPYSAAGDGTATISSFDTTAPIINVLEYQVFGYPDPVLEVEVMS